jgi:uncharacterized protein (TIGR03435 family)
VHYPAITLKLLILKAYDVQDTALSGPAGLNEEFVELDAVMPTNTSAEQFHLMLQNLLAERFKLAVHRELEAQSGYTLVVSKGGPKMKESVSDLPPLDETWKAKVGKDGFVVARPGQQLFVQDGRLRCRWTYQHASMALLASGLQLLLGSPVTDATGLTKNYDFYLTFRTAGTTKEAGPMAGVPWGPVGDAARVSDASALDNTSDAFLCSSLRPSDCTAPKID